MRWVSWIRSLKRMFDIDSRFDSILLLLPFSFLLLCLVCVHGSYIYLFPFISVAVIVSLGLVKVFQEYGLGISGCLWIGFLVAQWSYLSSFWDKCWFLGAIVSILVSLSLMFLVSDWLLCRQRSMQARTISQDEEIHRLKDKETQLLAEIKLAEQQRLDSESVMKNMLEDKDQCIRECLEKEKYLNNDLRILADQKQQWLDDYTSLYQEYRQLAEQVSSSNDVENVRKELMNQQEQFEHERNRLMGNILELQNRVTELTNHIAVLEEHSRKTEEETIETSVTKSQDTNYEAMYRQLREQFQGKQLALDEARRQLFMVQEQCLVLQREDALRRNTLALNDLDLLSDLGKRIEHLEEEVISLEGLVSHILTK